MFIKSILIQNIKKAILFIFVLVCLISIVIFGFIKLGSGASAPLGSGTSVAGLSGKPATEVPDPNGVNELIENNSSEDSPSNSYIKWVDFKCTADIMTKLANLDISSHQNDEEIKFNWIELMAYLACKYGGDFSKFKQLDLDKLVLDLKAGTSMDTLSKDYKLYDYFYESYDAIFHDYIGTYSMQSKDENGNTIYNKSYGLKAFSPIAKNYSFSHYKDFGSSRSYGYKRVHLGNDLLGSIGTPIIAVEGGYVEALGWNQYGGWRIGIRSFDKKRYYYYAHLRKDHPFAKDLSEGDIATAGDVIGYLGMTGYSSKENVNNINIPHLHFGIELIFDESQKDGYNQIWIDVYQIIEFLRKNSSAVHLAYPDTKDYERDLNMLVED